MSMRRLPLFIAVLWCLTALSGIALAAEYHVGPGQQYATLNDLLASVTLGDNDIAWIHPGTYGPVTISSGGGSSQETAAQVRAWDPNDKPVFDAGGADNLIHLEPGFDKWWIFDGLEIANAAYRGIFHVGGGLIVRNCYIHDCGNGIQSGMYNTQDDEPGYLIVEYTEFGNNGSNNRRHSIYAQEYWIKFRYNWIHDPQAGLCYKDRSRDSVVEFNLIEQGPNGPYAVEFCGFDDDTMPDVGQTATMTGNVVTKNGGTNHWLFIGNERGEGGISGGNNYGWLYLYNNTFYTEDHTGPMIGTDDGSIIEAHNNIFHSTTCDRIIDAVDYASGPGTVNTSYNNWVKTGISVPGGFTDTVFGSDPGVVNAAASGGDWHLTSSSPCRDAGREGLSVVPDKEYAHPCSYTSRPADGSIDIGAYEYSSGGSLPPVARFSGSPTSGYAPLTVNFTDESANDPTSWSWDFGDSGTSTAQNPSHEYTSGGDYTVSLTATNSRALLAGAGCLSPWTSPTRAPTAPPPPGRGTSATAAVRRHRIPAIPTPARASTRSP